MSLIKGQGTGEVSTGFYSNLLDQSIKFNDDDSSYLTRTPASAGNRRTWTWSAWVKFGAMSHGSGQITLFDASASASDQHGIVYSGQQFYVFGYAGGFTYRKMLTALHRDPSAWYHYVVAFDTTDSTASDRIKIYVNGLRQTSFDGTNTDPSLNFDTGFNNTVAHGLGARVYDGSNFFDGYIAEVNLIDGTALTADSFGETVQGIWTPKDTSGLTFGTNGFHLTFKDDVVSEGFNTVTYRGNNGSGTTGQSISGVGFKPALIWIGNRTNASTHLVMFDYVRGNQLWLETSSTDAEQDSGTYGLQTHDADGWTMGGGNDINRDGEPHVAWCWEAGGEPTATNSAGAGATPTAGSVKIDGSNLGSALAGTIPATKISANTAKGFSIVSYTGTGSTGTVAHGLNSALDFIIVKRLAVADNWPVYHSGNTSAPETDSLFLNTNEASQDLTYWNDTSPTSTVFSLGSNNIVNKSGEAIIAFCWHSVSGYSKFGSFTGNGGSQEITVGFRPALVAIKRTGATSNWHVFDATRNATNTRSSALNWDRTAAEATNGTMTFSATGFNDNGWISGSGQEIIYMAWADTREAAFFKDVSSNGNHFTPVNLDYRDSVPDTPTNNFATFNALNLPAAAVLSEGNTKFTQTSNDRAAIGNMAMSSGKWYYEVYYTAGTNPEAGLARVKDSFANSGATGSSDKFLYITNATSFRTPAWTSTDATGVSAQTSETILGFAIDADNGKAFISVNGTYINSGNPAAGSNPQATFDADWVTQTGGGVVPFIGVYTGTSGDVRINFGQDSSFAGNHATANANADGNGHGSFAYAPPSGFLALCSQNLPDVDIIDGTEHFDTALYTGNSSTQSITSLNFSPDWLWIKDRSVARGHVWEDVVRGAGKFLQSNTTSAEGTSSTTTQSFDANGFTQGSNAATNNASETYAAWSWLAGTAFSNDASATSVGTIDSSGQVNTTAGFSIISYTRTSSGSDTIAHGLSAKPEVVLYKSRSSGGWYFTHESTDGSYDFLRLDTTDANSNISGASAPTNTVFSNTLFGSAEDFIAYCFHSVDGYSKFGSYVGNGNADGTFVYTGFRPAWIMIKNIVDTEYWMISDNTRSAYNPANNFITPHVNSAEYSLGGGGLDIVSNGFKIRSTSGNINGSGDGHIYMAFADQPQKFSNAR